MVEWREKVPNWWANYSQKHYSKARRQIASFQERFPWQDLPAMTIDQFGRVSGDNSTFTHALIWGTKGVIDLGRVNDLGVWRTGEEWTTSSQDSAEAAFTRIRDGLHELATLASQNQWKDVDSRSQTLFGNIGSLKVKPLYLWFPEFLAPAVNSRHMKRILELLEQESPEEGLVARNRRLWRALHNEAAFNICDFEPLPSTHFFYWDEETKMYLKEQGVSPYVAIAPLMPTQDPVLTNALLAALAANKNVVLAGSPGTGKTWLAQQVSERIRSQPITVSLPSSPPRTWRDALALALYETDRHLKVRDLLEHPIVRAMVQATGKATANAYTTALNILSEHSANVPTKDRRPPVLFNRDEENAWFLIEDGREYVEQSLLPKNSESTSTENRVEFVTFHPSFGYEEFVEGIRPVMDEEGEGGLRYEVRPGPFLRVALAARTAWEADPQNAPDFLVVVDEINRADVARTFGDLLALIEPSKRLGQADELSVTLPYSGIRFALPPNLLLLATMNTSDRSVALMDLALRRRFAFVECPPNPDLLKTVADVNLSQLLKTLNEGIAALLGPDLGVGHAFLLHIADADGLEDAWVGKLMPQLVETFHGRGLELEALLGPAFFEPALLPKRLANLLNDAPRRLRTLKGVDLLEALRAIYQE